MVRDVRRRSAPENRSRRSPPRQLAPGDRTHSRASRRPHLPPLSRTKLLRHCDSAERYGEAGRYRQLRQLSSPNRTASKRERRSPFSFPADSANSMVSPPVPSSFLISEPFL